MDKHKHRNLTIDNPNLNNIDKIFYTYNNEYDNKDEYYLVRCQFILVFSNLEGYPVASSKLTNNKTMISRKLFVEKVIYNFKNEGYDFSHLSQINILIVCKKRDLTHEFYMKHNMPAVEWKLNAMINREKK